MTNNAKHWTSNIHLAEGQMDTVRKQLCQAFNHSPFIAHNGMQMRVVDEHIEGYITMQPQLIGNVAFQILHGGVAATLLDSIGGIVAMAALYERSQPDELSKTILQVSRLATVDMRVDYLRPGRGEHFIAQAEVLRLGKKGCTMRMNLSNEHEQMIATAIASYAF